MFQLLAEVKLLAFWPNYLYHNTPYYCRCQSFKCIKFCYFFRYLGSLSYICCSVSLLSFFVSVLPYCALSQYRLASALRTFVRDSQ